MAATEKIKPTEKVLRGGALGNRGNRRVGKAKGYRGQPGGAHQVSWREDRLFMADLEPVVRGAWIQRRPAGEILRLVNLQLSRQKPPQPPVQLTTVYEYIKRVQILLKEEQSQTHDLQLAATAAIDAEIAQIHDVQRAAWKAWNEKDQVGDSHISGINRDRLLATLVSASARIESLIATKAKFDGSFEAGSRYAGVGDAPDMPASPFEMVALGQASRQDLEVWLRFTAQRSGVKLPAPLPDRVVLEGEVVVEETVEEVIIAEPMAQTTDDDLDDIELEEVDS